MFKLECDNNEISALVDIDLDAYRKAYDNRTVIVRYAKTLRCRIGLTNLQKKNKANFSALLQEAIKQRYC